MALEITEMDVQTPIKKKKLVSMKKTATSEAPYPFKDKAELDAYRKNMESIVKPGYGEMGYKIKAMKNK